jgi:hypothetical protein
VFTSNSTTVREILYPLQYQMGLSHSPINIRAWFSDLRCCTDFNRADCRLCSCGPRKCWDCHWSSCYVGSHCTTGKETYIFWPHWMDVWNFYCCCPTSMSEDKSLLWGVSARRPLLTFRLLQVGWRIHRTRDLVLVFLYQLTYRSCYHCRPLDVAQVAPANSSTEELLGAYSEGTRPARNHDLCASSYLSSPSSPLEWCRISMV